MSRDIVWDWPETIGPHGAWSGAWDTRVHTTGYLEILVGMGAVVLRTGGLIAGPAIDLGLARPDMNRCLCRRHHSVPALRRMAGGFVLPHPTTSCCAA